MALADAEVFGERLGGVGESLFEEFVPPGGAVGWRSQRQAANLICALMRSTARLSDFSQRVRVASSLPEGVGGAAM